MVLNEDFFDNIEIKDDDLKNDSESELNTDDNKDAKTLLKDMFSSYKQCLCFRFSTPFDENRYGLNFDEKIVWNLFDKTNKWNLFKNTIRRVCNVFDVYAYDIKYSEPFFCINSDWYEIIHKKSNINLDIINIENNKVIVNTDIIELYKNLSPKDVLYAFMFIDLPVFNSAKRAYKFLYRIANSLQNMIHNNSSDTAFVYQIEKDNQQWYVHTDDMKIYFNNAHIIFIIKSMIMQYIKDDILYLLSPQYKYRLDFEKAQTDSELQTLIKNF